MSQADLLAQLSEDRAAALHVLFGEQHEDETPPFHLEIVDLWRSADENVLVDGFRGSAKTTLAQEFLACESLFANFSFALLICDTYTKACERLENIRYCLLLPSVRALFGEAIGKKNTENVLLLKNGVRLQAFGREQSPRGELHHSHRPDRAFLDDVEKLESVSSTSAVDDTMRWLYAQVMPAMAKKRKIRVAATPLAADCLVARLKRDPNWVYRSYPIVMGSIDDDSAIAMWPARYPLNWVRRQREMMKEQGMLTEFAQEYLCQARDERERQFDTNDLVEAQSPPSGWLSKYIIYDPARTAKKTSNRTGKVVVSWQGSKLYVVESGGYHWKPSELLEDIFRANAAHSPIAVGVESNSLDEFVREPLRLDMVRTQTSVPVVDLRAPANQSKLDFIKGLQPFCRAGEIILVGGKVAHKQLVAEMGAFPSSNDDVLNALAYALKMRPGQPVYEDFGPEHVVQDLQMRLGHPVYLAFNASLKETTCAAVQIVGQSAAILAEWCLPGDIADACASIKLAAQGLFARARVLAFAPGELHDDWARIPVVRHLRSAAIPPARAAFCHEARGSLAPYVRVRIRGVPGLVVGEDCKITLNALAGGYAIPVTPTGRLGEQPVDNHYRTLIQGCEALIMALNASIGGNIASANYATNPEGQRYITSRPLAARAR